MIHGGFGGDLRYQSFGADKQTIITKDDLANSPNPYDWELTSFFDWIRDDVPPLFTGETGRANVAVAEGLAHWENRRQDVRCVRVRLHYPKAA